MARERLLTDTDSSMLNSSQVMDDWQEYFDFPTGSRLGILNSIYQIGSIASFPFAYVASSYPALLTRIR